MRLWSHIAELGYAGMTSILNWTLVGQLLPIESGISLNGKKYLEIIADNLSKAGWSWGCVSAGASEGRTIWIADAHRAMESVLLCVRMKN